MTEPSTAGRPREGTRARIERAAVDLFTRYGFADVPIESIAEAAQISRRTYFRYFATKADAVWGDFAGHVARLERLLHDSDARSSVLAALCDAYVEVNDYPTADLPLLRRRMQLILGEPALQAHSQLRYAEVDRVVAEYVAARTGVGPGDLLPRLVATTSRAAATTAFEAWLRFPDLSLDKALRMAFEELTTGFGSLRLPAPGGGRGAGPGGGP